MMARKAKKKSVTKRVVRAAESMARKVKKAVMPKKKKRAKKKAKR